jgi:hypothetical protein
VGLGLGLGLRHQPRLHSKHEKGTDLARFF